MSMDRKIPETEDEYFFTAIETIASMCHDYLMGEGVNNRTFVSNLELYAKELRKIIDCDPDDENNKRKDSPNDRA